MKFFTRAWCAGQLEDARADAVRAAYWHHIDAVCSKLPATVVSLARGINMHDGLFRSVRLVRADRRIEMVLRCGDRPGGYFDLSLSYGAVDFQRSNLTSSSRIVEDPHTEVLYDEVDLVGKNSQQCVHRILCWPEYRELSVVFETLGLRLKPTSGRKFRRAAHVYLNSEASRPTQRLRPTALRAVIQRRG